MILCIWRLGINGLHHNDKCLGELFLKSFNLFYFKLLIAPFLRHNGTATAGVCRRNWNENYDFIGRLVPWFPAFDWSPDKIKSINFPLSDWQLLKTNQLHNFPTILTLGSKDPRERPGNMEHSQFSDGLVIIRIDLLICYLPWLFLCMRV